MGCASGIVKTLLICANLLFVLAGISILTLGILGVVNLNKTEDFIPEQYEKISMTPILAITIGSIIFLIAFFGCCGACQENTCLLTTYSIILMVILLVQIAGGILAFIEIQDQDDLKKKVNDTMTTVFNKHNATSEIIILLQNERQCCGINGSTYWPQEIETCCKNDKCERYTDPCPQSYYNYLISSINVLGIVMLSLGATEIIGCIFSLCLANSIRNEERRSAY